MNKPTKATSPEEYINLIEDPKRREQIESLHKFIKQVIPKEKPRIMSGMIGYGEYAYKSKSGSAGTWSVVALASQKNYISIYICAIKNGRYLAEQFKDRLPKADIGKSCVRVKDAGDIDLTVLQEMILEGMKFPLGAASHIS
jgi:hypothetical protein